MTISTHPSPSHILPLVAYHMACVAPLVHDRRITLPQSQGISSLWLSEWCDHDQSQQSNRMACAIVKG